MERRGRRVKPIKNPFVKPDRPLRLQAPGLGWAGNTRPQQVQRRWRMGWFKTAAWRILIIIRVLEVNIG